MADDDNEIPAIRWGEPGFYEDWLIGNRSGFAALRDTIDAILADEADAPIPDNCECDFQGLSIHANSDRSAEKSASGTLFTVGCFVALLFVVTLLGLGVWKLIELFLG